MDIDRTVRLEARIAVLESLLIDTIARSFRDGAEVRSWTEECAEHTAHMVEKRPATPFTMAYQTDIQDILARVRLHFGKIAQE